MAFNLRACVPDPTKLVDVIAPARDIATRALHRVMHDDAWAAPALDAEVRRGSLSPTDSALATQIVYGTLRVVPELEASLAQHAQRSIKVDDWTRAALLGAAFQLLHLERVPPRAIVHDTVELVRAKRGKRVAGFANAILRRLAADRPEAPQLPSSVVVPTWLRDALHHSIGAEHAAELLRTGRQLPSIDLRVRTNVDRDEVARAIRARRPEAAVCHTTLSPFGLRVSRAGDPRALAGYAEGAFAIQEEGAQVIGMLLDAQPGERVLDACAGRGGKTSQLVEAVREDGTVVAADLHEHRLEQVRGELRRLGLSSDHLEMRCVDWTVGRGAVEGPFDRVLVDAPCTGLGTLRRRPEILLRSKPSDAAHMGDVQRRILENAAALVRPGGTLVYAVCSPLEDEGSAVAERADLRAFELRQECPSIMKSLSFEPDGRLALGPWVSGAGPWADAYQIYMWVHVG